MDDHPDAYLDIPAFLKGNVSNTAESMNMAMSETVEDATPKPKVVKAKATAKANGHAKPPAKATGKLKAAKVVKVAAKAKAAPKVKAKAAKGSEKPKVAKPKAEGAKKDAWGFREGSAKSQAVALYAAKGGATLEEVKAAVGSVQLNVLNSLEEAGHEVKRNKEEREGQRSVTRYFLKMKK